MGKIKTSFMIILSMVVALSSMVGTIFILQSTGSLVTEKIALEITTENATNIVYDGKSHTAKNINYDESLLQHGDSVELIKFSNEITDVGSIEVTPEVRILDSNKNDVTNKYKISYIKGNVQIIPRPINIKPKDITALYDAKVITPDDFEIISGSLIAGHKISPTFIPNNSAINVGDYKSQLSTRIYDILGNDVTSNYDITNTNGNINIEKNVINLKFNNINKTFDNKPLSIEEITYDLSTTMDLNGKKLSAKLEFDKTILDNIKYVDTYKNLNCIPNKTKIFVNNELINSDNYILSITTGVVEITPMEISINTIGKTFTYDSKIHNNFEISYSDELSLFLKDNNLTLDIDENLIYDNSISSNINQFEDAGLYDNKFIVLVKEKDNDISKNFNINYSYGKITIEERNLKVKTKSIEEEFDGEEHYSNSDEYDFIDGILEQHNLSITYSLASKIMYVGEIINEINSINIIDSKTQKNVTSNYNIEIIDSLIKVKPRIIEVQTNDIIDRVYNNTNFQINEDDYVILNQDDNLILNNYELSASTIYNGVNKNVLNRVITKEEEIPNQILFKVLDNNEDLSSNFIFKSYRGEYNGKEFINSGIENTYGIIEIKPKTINVNINKIEKTYDNKPITTEKIEYYFEKDINDKNINGIGLYGNHYVKYFTFDYLDSANNIRNVLDSKKYNTKDYIKIDSIIIFDENNNNIANYYNFVISDSATVEFKINQCEINSENISIDSKIYSGNILTPTINCTINNENVDIIYNDEYINSNIDKFTNAGLYLLGYNAFNTTNSNYYLSENISVQMVINKKELTATWYDNDSENKIIITDNIDYSYVFNDKNQKPYLLINDGNNTFNDYEINIIDSNEIIVSEYKNIGKYTVSISLNDTNNYYINNSNYSYKIVSKIIYLNLKQTLPEGYKLKEEDNKLSKEYDTNPINFNELFVTDDQTDSSFINDINIYAIDSNGNKLDLINAGDYENISLTCDNNNIGLALNQELNIIINPKNITYSLVDDPNIKYKENNEGKIVFIKNYDGNVIDYRKYIDSDYLKFIDVEENYSQTNDDDKYYTLTLKSNSENYKFEKEEYIYVHIPKIKINFKLVEKYFEGGDIFYDLSSNIELIENDDLYSIQINDNYLTNNLKKDITLSIEELSEGDINDFNGITKELSLDNVKKLVKLKVITIVLRENGKILNINDNILFYNNNNEIISNEIDIEIIRFIPFDVFNIIPNEITVTYLDELIIAENTLGYTCNSSSGNLPLNISYSFENESTEINENLYNEINNMSLNIEIGGFVYINYLKNGISYDLTNVLYIEKIINPLKVKVEKANISITTKSGSKTIDCDWNDELFDESLLNIPNKYSDLIYSIEFENTEANEVGTYSNSISINEEFYDFYNITFVFGTLTVYPKKTQIIASNTSISYGTPFVMSSAIRYYGDSLEEDINNSLCLYDLNNNSIDEGEYSTLSVGTYRISIEESALESQEGYEIDFYEGTLEVTPANLYVSVYDHTYEIGDSDKDYYDDFINNNNIYYTNSTLNLLNFVCDKDSFLEDVYDMDFYAYTEEEIYFDSLQAEGYDILVNCDNINENYNIIVSKTGKLKFNKCKVSIKVLNQTKVYDGKDCRNDLNSSLDPTTYEITTNAYGHEKFLNDTDFLSNSIDFLHYSGSDVGSYPITINCSNTYSKYDVEIINGYYIITQFVLTLIPDSYTKTYDGNAVEEDDLSSVVIKKSTSIIPEDLKSSLDSVSVALNNNSCKDAGIYYDDIGLKNVPDETDNYKVIAGTSDIIITPFEITLTPQAYTKTYDGTEEINVPNLYSKSYIDPLPTDWDDVSSSIFVELVSGEYKNAGIYPNVIKIDGISSNDNYIIYTRTADITINKFKITLTSDSYTRGCDGNAVTQTEIDSLSYSDNYIGSSTPSDYYPFVSSLLVTLNLSDLNITEKGTYLGVIKITVDLSPITNENYEVITKNGDIIIN